MARAFLPQVNIMDEYNSDGDHDYDPLDIEDVNDDQLLASFNGHYSFNFW